MSCTANPSRKNSGFHANVAPGTRPATNSANRAAVPTGTVDFPTITSPGATYSNTDANAASTNRISAASPCADCGVPTATKCTCAPATAAKSVVNDNRPLAIAEPNTSANPGSKNGARPADNAAIFTASTSTPTTV